MSSLAPAHIAVLTRGHTPRRRPCTLGSLHRMEACSSAARSPRKSPHTALQSRTRVPLRSALSFTCRTSSGPGMEGLAAALEAAVAVEEALGSTQAATQTASFTSRGFCTNAFGCGSFCAAPRCCTRCTL